VEWEAADPAGVAFLSPLVVRVAVHSAACLAECPVVVVGVDSSSLADTHFDRHA
jgi:hypothetical protein